MKILVLILNVNARVCSKYNFGLRVGNDEQNAVRLGISKGQFQLGNSFRKPNPMNSLAIIG